MTAILHAGGCHCGALRLEFSSARPLRSFVARACDCDFCTRHRAAWVSDPAGQLRILADTTQLQRYRQGSAQAEFLLCRECGVLVAVMARAVDGRLLGAANRNAINDRMDLIEETIVSPRLLAPDSKLARWSEVWMPTDLVTCQASAT
ncbi:GFA family protein [Cognatiluteimonas profundi]|uniref:GFA family protein n=1 Tax=Cognatiluteimonas profundi TaxID=2594501 RepID=UPI00131BD788|nr:aldehyde-activating protein [Lysobacter profundi]